MKFKGKIKEIMPRRSGTSAKTGNQWVTQEYVIEETFGEYPGSVLFTVFGDNIERFNLQLGEVVTIDFDMFAREYNGRYYNSAKCWAVNRGEEAEPESKQTAQEPAIGVTQQPQITPAPPAPAPVPSAQAAPPEQEELPF